MTYIIAEVGGNHDGDIDKAITLIEKAKLAGCDAVKFQTYEASKLVHPKCKALKQAKGYDWQIDRFRDLELLEDDWQDIINKCQEIDIDFMTTAFDIESLKKFAPDMGMIKIASGDLTYKNLLTEAALLGKHVLLSTGMSNIPEIVEASKSFNPQYLTVMHCVSLYPTPPERANLGVIMDLMRIFQSVGYSDHTIGPDACLIAASMGCDVIEKHFTYNSKLEYGDHPFSLDVTGMKGMVDSIRKVELMMGHNKPDPLEDKHSMRRGMYAARSIKKGEVIEEADILHIRPYTRPITPGKVAKKDFKLLDALDG